MGVCDGVAVWVGVGVYDKAATANCACKVCTAMVERELRSLVDDGIGLAVDDEVGVNVEANVPVGDGVKAGVIVAGSVGP